MDANDTNKIILKDLSYKLNGIFFKVHNKLGRFLKEKQYADEIEKFFKNERLNYQREFTLKNISGIEHNRVDFLVNNEIIVDVKAKRIVTKDDYYQMLRYLKSANLRLGLIVNFRNTYLKAKRIVGN
ncbi:MAG: GxxExxY protein [Patescibacteria group bacterium]